MSNKELLINAGWFIEDGWLCNPSIDGEKVFSLDLVDGYSIGQILAIVSASAANHGSRWQQKESKSQLKSQLIEIANSL